LGPECHPTRRSIPFVTYSHAAALAEIHDVTLVARSIVEDDLRSANGPFQAIEIVKTPFIDAIEAWSLRRILNYNYDSQLRTALKYPAALSFERHAWRQFKDRIMAGEFDVVLRLVPMSPSLPSPFAFFLRNGPIPFVLGPLNGGLPWPPGFSQLENQREWVAGFRNLYRFMPYARSTYRHAAAIIAGSSQTYSEFVDYREKLFFIPEPGISSADCVDSDGESAPDKKLELIFVGGLVPRKACDLAVRGAAPLLRDGRAQFVIVGDGPERSRIEELARTLGIESSVTFCGWVSPSEVFNRFRSADVFVFPSLRDNGAGVVFQALATGTVPVVADFGGPGDIVNPDVGRKVPLTNEDDIAVQLERVLKELEGNRELLGRLRRNGLSYARENLTWDAKAGDTTKVLKWVTGRDPKPDLMPPKMLDPSGNLSSGTSSSKFST